MHALDKIYASIKRHVGNRYDVKYKVNSRSQCTTYTIEKLLYGTTSVVNTLALIKWLS